MSVHQQGTVAGVGYHPCLWNALACYDNVAQSSSSLRFERAVRSIYQGAARLLKHNSGEIATCWGLPWDGLAGRTRMHLQWKHMCVLTYLGSEVSF